MNQVVLTGIIIFSLILLALNLIPQKIKGLNLIVRKSNAIIGLPNTVIHEFCHSLAAFVTFGKVVGIKINKDGSGEAFSATGSYISRVITILAGYIGASAFSYLFVILLTSEKTFGQTKVGITLIEWIEKVAGFLKVDVIFVVSEWIRNVNQVDWIFYIFMIITLFTLIYIRNFFGFLYVGAFMALWGIIAYYDLQALKNVIVYYIAIVTLAYSLYSAFVILKLSYLKPDNAGDATSMKKVMFLPSVFWGFMFFAQAVVWYGMSIAKMMN